MGVLFFILKFENIFDCNLFFKFEISKFLHTKTRTQNTFDLAPISTQIAAIEAKLPSPGKVIGKRFLNFTNLNFKFCFKNFIKLILFSQTANDDNHQIARTIVKKTIAHAVSAAPEQAVGEGLEGEDKKKVFFFLLFFYF